MVISSWICIAIYIISFEYYADVVASTTPPRKKSYAGYRIIQAKLTDGEQRWLLRELNHYGNVRLLSPTAALSHNLQQSRPIAALVPPENWQNIESLLKERGVNYDTVVDDFQKYIDDSMKTQSPRTNKSRLSRSRRRRYRRESQNHMSKLNRYHSYGEIADYLKSLEKSFPGIIQLGKLGLTSEKRTLYAVHLGQKFPKRSRKNHPKAVIVVDAGIHAREWITISSALCLIVHLATYYESDAFLQQFHWVILPVVNADGYEYSWKSDRLWRKTRSKPRAEESGGIGGCVGVDPNRNWGTHWGEKGVQRYNVCTEVYAGPYPFSEPEVAALSDIIEYYREHIALHISLHAFSQVILSPFGYKSGASADHKKQVLVMKAGADAIKATSGLSYNYGSIYDSMYAASGSSIDFIYEGLGVKHTFVIELRDTGKFGFVLPQREILPTCKESIAAIIAMAKEASKKD